MSLTLIAILSLAPALQDNTLTEEEKTAGWKLLFDGKTTDGWKGYKKDKPGAGWQVVDGVLTLTKGGGDICTVEEFADFELKVDWKIAPKGNSGIMYRVAETRGAPYETGPEYQVLDDAGHGFMRAGEMPNAKDDDKKARADAWVRIKDLLKKL